ncbi:MAG: glycoside hydrolase family 2 TIM barrel-domain containing protein [Kiritimatiellales bacterium]|jgi:beta-galactosidase
MKKILFTSLLLAAGFNTRAALPPEIENPECLGINKQPYHATLMPYATLKQAIDGKRMESPFCRLLNGTWKFNWVKHPDERPLDFYKSSFDVSDWKDIPVPSCWQVLGYGTPYYKNSGYVIQKDFPRVMTEPPKDYTAFVERNPVGSYRRDFDLPADWAGRRIFLSFSGVDSAFFVWINGKKVGYSVNSRNTAEFDVTPFVKPGRNMVAVEVYRFSSGTWLEDQDMWRLSGIFRDVYLWSAPQVHIRDFFALPDLDAQYKNASLAVTAKVKNFGEQAAAADKLTATVYDAAGKAVAQAAGEVPALAAGAEMPVLMILAVANPAKWTAETPNLYTTVLTLGKNNEIISTRTGFRKVEIKGRVYQINGVPVKLKGANRHEMEPDTGHTVSEARMIRDIEVLKQGNCNHVRTCHYSDDPRWYELCDRYGIYLCAEANVENHGDGSMSYRKETESAYVDRNVANVENFKNHASVVMWSLGNEGGSGPNFVTALKAVKTLDTSRPTHYQGFGVGDKNPADVDSHMYAHWIKTEEIAKDPSFTKPFYLCEYAHAMNNSMGSIGEYNDIFDKYPELMGGAIWEWQDQGLWNRRDTNRVFLAYGGGFGEVPNNHYFIHKGVVFADRSPKPHYPEMKKAYQWIAIGEDDLAAGKVKIRNKYAFISLGGFTGEWSVTGDGQEIGRGTLPKLNIAPGTEQTVTLPLPKIAARPGVEYFLRVSFKLAHDELWAKAGHEVARQQFKLPAATPSPVADISAMKPVTLKQDGSVISVAGNGFAVTFDKITGFISALERDGINLLTADGGPRLHLWRAAHKTDDMWAFNEWQRYGLIEPQWKVVNISAQQAGPAAVRVTASLELNGSGNLLISHSAAYTIYGDGSIAVDNSVIPQGKKIPFARLGVRLLLDPKLDRFAYLGRGPMENYADRKRGSDVGLYSSTVRGNMTPYAKPMECGNHEDVRWAAVSGQGLPGLMAQAEAGSVLQAGVLPYTDEQMEPVEYTVDLPPGKASVLVLAAKTTGVGSASCGPLPADEYIVWSTPATFSYVLRLLPASANLPQAGRVQVPANRVKPVLAVRDTGGDVTLSSDTAGAKIEYAVGGAAWQTYTAPFKLTEAAQVAVRANAAGMSGYETVIPFNKLDHRLGWKISVSSAQPDEGDPANVLDGQNGTFWHSRWSKNPAAYPHWLIADFGRPLTITAVTCLPRQGKNSNGRIKDFEIYLSDDGKQWGKPVAAGSFKNTEAEQIAKLAEPVSGRYIKFVALSEVTGQKFASMAEFDVISAE